MYKQKWSLAIDPLQRIRTIIIRFGPQVVKKKIVNVINSFVNLNLLRQQKKSFHW